MRRAVELTLITETLRGHFVTKEELTALEEKLKPFWRIHGINLDLTNDHFVEQLTRLENRHHPISYTELDFLLNKFTIDHTSSIPFLENNSYGVIKEPHIHTNLVFFIDGNSKSDLTKEIRLITIMRKKDFHTPNKIYEVKLD